MSNCTFRPAVPMDEWTVYRLTGETLEEAAQPE